MKFSAQLKADNPDLAAKVGDDVLTALDAEFSDSQGGSPMDKTYTEAELAAKIAEAIRPLQEKFDGLEASADEEARKAEVAQLHADANIYAEAIWAKVDEQAAAAKAATDDKDIAEGSLAAVLYYFAGEAAAAEEAAAVEARKAERVETVKALNVLPEARLTESADRWAAMADEEFAACVEDYKVLGTKGSGSAGAPAPATTLLETAAAATGGDVKSYLNTNAALKQAGIDPTRLY